ncbi:hypothetical protein H5410_041027 [Solanum commersonii]|uniref:DUF7746 domain-containing protein n=1 Tax=Solanum commersonii TaxID=4109 RepID=A0A9J5XQM9_SOLCO|nr:hypothetical protein H5410_041027 [Solanum commersonii]
MIIAGFTGQLRGWWDNYMSLEAKAAVLNAKVVNDGVDNLGFALVKNREDTVYTLVLLEEVDVPQNLDLLNKWTIPKVLIKTIYDYGWFDKLSSKQLIKTTEESLALNSFEQTIRLLNERDVNLYKN